MFGDLGRATKMADNHCIGTAESIGPEDEKQRQMRRQSHDGKHEDDLDHGAKRSFSAQLATEVRIGKLRHHEKGCHEGTHGRPKLHEGVDEVGLDADPGRGVIPAKDGRDAMHPAAAEKGAP